MIVPVDGLKELEPLGLDAEGARAALPLARVEVRFDFRGRQLKHGQAHSGNGLRLKGRRLPAEPQRRMQLMGAPRKRKKLRACLVPVRGLAQKAAVNLHRLIAAQNEAVRKAAAKRLSLLPGK